jgi:ferrochelatase
MNMVSKQPVRRGILLMNLGSPDSTEVPDVKRYLDEFLMDKRVIDYPYLQRLLFVKGLITPRRAPHSAEAYKKIWWPEGSPLIVLTERLGKALEEETGEAVETAMRYGNPHPEAAFEKLMKRVPGLQEVLAVPLYPHYAMSSYETAVESTREIYRKGKYPFRISFTRPFYREPAYINALAESIRPYLSEDDYLLFSYHGLPERHIRKADGSGSHCLQSGECCFTPSPAHRFCYRHQVLTTMELTAKELGLTPEQYGFSFQSRLGREQWIKPYTVEVLKELPKKGIKKLAVVCPAFVSDCLETLEEMAMQGKETFLSAGGESYQAIPCLNTQPLWLEVLGSWVRAYAGGDKSLVNAL